MSRRFFPIVLAVSVVILSVGADSTTFAAPMVSSSAVLKAVLKYFGKEGAEEATEYLTRQGGRELAERVAKTALKEGGEEGAEQVTRLVAKHGPEALRALDNAPTIGPVLKALAELPESEARAAITRLAAGSAGRELAETVARNGVSALKGEIAHPGLGGALVRALGDDGAELAGKLSTNQALAVARHADDLAGLPAAQRSGVMSILRNDAERMVGFMGRFAADNPGKTLFTAATTAIILAEPERILGGDEIVFDADGNPILISKAGIAGRTVKAGGEALGHVSSNYIFPLYATVLAFVVTFASLFAVLKLWHVHKREQALTQSALIDADGGKVDVIDGKLKSDDVVE